MPRNHGTSERRVLYIIVRREVLEQLELPVNALADQRGTERVPDLLDSH